MINPTLTRFRPILSLVLGLVALIPLRAANPPENGASPVQSPPAVDQPRLINIDFAGGTLAQLIAALGKDNMGAFNLIGEKTDLATVLPPFSLHSANPGAVSAALNILLRPRGLTIYTQGKNGIDVVTQIPRSQGYEPPKNAFLSIQLAPYLEAQSVDDVVGAIRAAWTLDPEHRPEDLRVQFHPATKLLLVSGPNRETEAVVMQVMQSLRHAASPPAKENPKPASSSPPAAEHP